MRYDVKKLRETIKAREEDHWDGEEMTQVYSALAHIRGRLHMTKLRVDSIYNYWYKKCWANGRAIYMRGCAGLTWIDESKMIISWTMEDQAAFVEELLKKYEIEEEEIEEEIEAKQESLVLY